MTEDEARKILGVPVGATEHDIKHAWSGQIRIHPPDSDPVRNQAINEAKQTLLGRPPNGATRVTGEGSSDGGPGGSGITKQKGPDNSGCCMGCGCVAVVALCIAFPPLIIVGIIVAVIVALIANSK